MKFNWKQLIKLLAPVFLPLLLETLEKKVLNEDPDTTLSPDKPVKASQLIDVRGSSLNEFWTSS